MGRRRWRFIAIAAFLLVISRDATCQDENDFFYTPVERSFAQVQPPLFPNNRPATYYENDDSYRLPQANIPNNAQQQIFSDVNRFPSPNYNQHPSPFQLPTGRSQAPGQFYLNQPEFTASQRQRFRPSFPHNFQFVHPASTRRPDTPQIHSVAYQNDPSKPETFLGQITLNNPDVDFLQSGRFKNSPFDGNSIKGNNQQSQVINDDDSDSDNQDLFVHHRVTTYNPNKLSSKQRLNLKSNIGHISHHEASHPEEQQSNSSNNKYLHSTSTNNNNPSSLFLRNSLNPSKSTSGTHIENSRQTTSTEYKALLDIEPLLEDDITDITSFRELMKNTQGSFDVQVIKSNDESKIIKNDYDKYDSNPSASSMNADNISKEMHVNITDSPKQNKLTNITLKSNNTTENLVSNNSTKHDIAKHDDLDDAHEEIDDDGEYVEYYDESESTEFPHTTQNIHTTEHSPDIYDEYDISEETEQTPEDVKSNSSKSFDILPMTPNNTMVKDDNFKHFVDTTVIDQTDIPFNNDPNEFNTESLNSDYESSSEDSTSLETPSILGQEVVSVVTTKSVVNGTISIPDVTYAPGTTKLIVTTEFPLASTENNSGVSTSVPNTTENWIVVASVQTSRSVSGARFLPFPAVEQDEKKQILQNTDDDETVTRNPKISFNDNTSHSSTTSTENINDKLDTIQSELSSAVLSGALDNEDKNIAHITESTTELTTTTTSTTPITLTTLNVFTLKSTQPTIDTEKSAPDPLPVVIKKFTPRITTTSSTTTVRPKKKLSLVTVMDELSPGLLPSGYKPRLSYKDKKTSTTTSTTTTTTTTPTPKTETSAINEEIINQGRSSGITSQNKVIILDEKSLLPKDYKPPSDTKQRDQLLKNFKHDDLSKLLPPGYKPPTSTVLPKQEKGIDILEKVKKVDISAFLPKDFNKETVSATKGTIESKLLESAAPVDISAFLPPGFKLNSTNDNKEDLDIKSFKGADVASLLPPGFKLNSSDIAQPSTTTKEPSNGFKVVFPSRPGAKSGRKTTTPKTNTGIGPEPVTPKIHKGWPVRASTEFTGWPSPSTTPFSIEKLLEAQRNATATSPLPELSTEATTRRTTSTSTTTSAPPPPTTPGVCRKECDIAATIKIVAGVKWVPELLDHHTDEWKNLAKDVKQELNSVYSKSDLLKKWYKGIRIDAFSQGSVLVDYFVELNDVEERIDTLEIKNIFHRSLDYAKPGSVIEAVTEPVQEFDSDVMLGDQPVENRKKKSDEKMTKTIDKSEGKLEIGKFVMDPAYTEFIVLPKREEATVVLPEEESFLPQWGIAVIVIALASLLFVVIFGVTVLVNRQKSAKAKQPIPLSEDMLRELDKSHMGGFDDVHQMKERDLPYVPSGKRMSTAFIEQLAYPNPGDSWRSEWTPQMQKYMQHYTPDSGRGSQIYGAGGNVYGYGGSQLYGQTGGGGSQTYGHTGEYPRSHYSRRRSDYDSNF